MNKLTNEELRRKIAEALYETRRSGKLLHLIDPSRLPHLGGKILATIDWPVSDSWRAFLSADVPNENIPDWPNDPGAALALCREIGRQRGYHLIFVDSPPIDDKQFSAVMFVADVYWLTPHRENIMVKSVFSEDGATDAEALANLALIALEARAISDISHKPNTNEEG